MASVTGAVGSVTGSVGSVVGNVGGNVVGTVASVVGAVGSVTGAVGSVTGNVGGNVVGTVASVVSIGSGAITAASFATGAIDSDAVNADALDSIVIESGINLPQAMAIDLAVSAGQSTGLDVDAPVYKAAGNPGTTRITAVASDGNRTSVTLNLP